MFVQKVLKRQLKANGFEYFTDVDYPNVIMVFIGNNFEKGLLEQIATDINKVLIDKGQLIGFRVKQGFMEFSFYKKG